MKLYYCLQFELFFLLSPFVFLGHSNLKWAQTAHFRVTSFLDPNNRISNITIRSKLVNPIAAWVCYFQHAVHNHIQYLLYILVYCTLQFLIPFQRIKNHITQGWKKTFCFPTQGWAHVAFCGTKWTICFLYPHPRLMIKAGGGYFLPFFGAISLSTHLAEIWKTNYFVNYVLKLF